MSLGFMGFGDEYIKPASHGQDPAKSGYLLGKHLMKGVV